MIFQQILRYLGVGLTNTALGLTAILLLQYGMGFEPYISNAIGYLFGGAISYFLNQCFTFASTRPKAETFPKFVGAYAFSYLCNMYVLNILLGNRSVPGFIAQALAVITFSVVFFCVCRAFVFAK